MEILLLGGREFLGRALVDSLCRRGHSVTLFNRGNNPGLFADLELIRGDRNTDFALLRGRRWDAVIDTCGYFPAPVRIGKTNGLPIAPQAGESSIPA